jgi:hypothetical protein
MFDPFINNSADSTVPPPLEGPFYEGYYGSGMYALSNDYGKLGPYNEGDAVARHQFTGSDFHRDVDFCGTCHDVSNSAVGQLAPNAGAQPGAPAVIRNAELGYHQILNPNVTPHDPATLGGNPLDPASKGMAAFENPPYAYGIVERTFSEYKSSPLSSTPVDSFGTLPADLQDPRGSLYSAYMAATTNGTRSANYVDGDQRFFSCQTCHMRAITGRGCDKADAPNRFDQPMHDQTGGNYWVFPLIKYQDTKGTLRLGGGLSAEQIEAMDDGTLRAGEHLTQAGTLDVNGDLVRITNMTGHKLISGYPEGRRMWLNIKWFDNQGVEMIADEVGAWGELPVDPITNPANTAQTFIPKSIVNLDDPRLKVYEVHPAMTQEWATVLRSIGYPADMPLSFDRLTGDVDYTLGELAAQAPGTYHETFHFVLNNYIAFDNRIPPYQMSYDEAQRRNALPVPANQYGGSPGGVYQHWDEFDIGAIAPQGASSAQLTLYYQGTSWEYVQFLNNAVDTTDDQSGAPNPVTPFLADEGKNYLDAWVNAGTDYGALGPMVPPYPMATVTWMKQDGCTSTEPTEVTCDDGIDNDCDTAVDCADPDCSADPFCDPGNLIEFPFCFDGLDNDNDGLTDCADRTDCDGVSDTSTCGVGVCAATGTQTCNNGTLDDTCTPGTPTEVTETTCNDGFDNDCDGFTDNADSDCGMVCSDYTVKDDCNMDPNCEWVGSPKNGSCQDACTSSPEGPPGDPTCTDGVDNDCDGQTDANDPDCQECIPVPEICNDGIDNDCDGAVDGTDPDCVMNCSDYGDRTSCRDALCKWDNKTVMCVNP